MHALAQQTVRRALAGGARIDPIEAFPDLAALDAAARRIESPLAREFGDLLDRPFLVGDVALYTPSYAALQWIGEADEWFERPRETFYLACAWALAHARDPDAFRAASSAATAIRVVKAWARKCSASYRLLIETTAAILEAAQRDPDEALEGSPREKDAFGPRLALARLLREFGQDEDFWLFGPRERLDAAMEMLRRKDEAEAAALAKAEKRAEAIDPEGRSARAFRAWRKVSDAFLSKYLPPKKEVAP